LEIGDESSRLPVFPVVILTPPYLLAYRWERAFLPQLGTPAIAVYAAAFCYRPIPIRTGKTGVNRQLVNLTAEPVPPEALEIVIPFRIVPEFRFGQKYSLSSNFKVGYY
jgi:hypothetical protein